MKRFVRIAFVAVIIVCAPGILWSQEISDLIAPVNLHAGRADSIVVSDLFYADHYNLRFVSDDHISITYDPQRNIAVLEPKNGFVGATVVDFFLGETSYSLPVYVLSERSDKQPHIFQYKTTARPGKVTVTGSFNNWNKSSHELTDAKGTGTYETSIPLDPGSYLYKFVVDGKEIVDPANPERSPTGFDDFNSILRIPDPDSSKLFLHIGSKTETKSDVRLTFVCEHPWKQGSITRNDVIALLDNRRIKQTSLGISNNVIELRIAKSELAGDRTVRVLVAHNGKQTNLQQVVLHHGVPAGLKGQSFSWSDGVIYSILVDRFNDGDKSNNIPVLHDSLFRQANYQGGDFKGIINKIEDGYLDSLGVNVLWISPVYDNPDVAFREYPPPHRWYSGYHGYWPISDTLVEEKFGTMAELKELVAKAHLHGMRVLLDFVAHHVHIDHPFYKQHPEWFGTLDLPDGRKNLRLWDEFRLSTWFEPYMPSFDFTKSAEAVNVVAGNAVWWLKETGADGFRHDAVKHVPNFFWRELTRRLKAEIEIPLHRKVYQIGETFGDDDLISSYINNGQLSAQFNFNLSYLAIPVFLEPEQSFSTLDYYLRRSFKAFGPYNVMGNIMDSHDKVRYMAYADGKVKNQGVDTREMAWKNPPTVDHPSSYRKAELYLTYLMTMPGLPVIYYGSEFGMTGADDPDNRRMMRFDGQLTSLERQMMEVIREITKLRNSHSALRYGDVLALKADVSVYAYLRSDFNERVLVVLNKSEKAKTMTLQLPSAYKVHRLVDLMNGTSIAVKNRNAHIELPGIGFRVFRVD
jgi:cyclomaltodextrinase / maltogenic alpha-amylase / neopullulanase